MTIGLLFQCCCVHTTLVGVLLLLQDSWEVKIVTSTNESGLQALKL